MSSTVGAFALMYALHHFVHSLPYDRRVPVFLAFSVLYLFWPIVATRVPLHYLFAVSAFPLFGIWLGIWYTSDIGPDSYMFAAQPDCFTGLWGVVVTGGISYVRLFKR